MTYEEHLDEVTTLIVEKYDLEDEAIFHDTDRRKI